MTNLISLDLSKNKIVVVQGLENLKLLQKLDVSFNMINSVFEVNKLKVNISLRFLELAGNPIA